MTDCDWLTIEGLRIRYIVVSAKTDNPKVPLLICNGLGQSIETLMAFADSLEDRDVVLFDAPGVGRSQVPKLPLPMRRHARIAAALLDAIGVEIVDVMGISWGGALAQQFAWQFSARCRKLVLAVTTAGGLAVIPGNPMLFLEVGLPTRFFSEWSRRKLVPILAGGDARVDPTKFHRVYTQNKMPPLYGYYCQGVTAGMWNSLLFLHRLKQPTLVISGDKDPLLPPLNQRVLACLIPNSQLQRYDCGHFLHVTRQDQVVKDVRRFLNETAETTVASGSNEVHEKTLTTVKTFFDALMEQDIERVMDTWADESVIELPLAPEGFPFRLDGKKNVKLLFEAFTRKEFVARVRFRDFTFHEMLDPQCAVVEFRGDNELANGATYKNTYCGIFRVKDGEITRYVEYANPVIVERSFGGGRAFAEALGVSHLLQESHGSYGDG